MEHWIEEREFAPSVSVAGLKSIEDIKEKKTIQGETRDLPEMVIANGRVQWMGPCWWEKAALLLGGMVSSEPNYLKKASPAITRFVPGREGLGLTDRIDSVVNFMKRNNILVFDQNYGLWYDRRRDDHERIRRRDGDVWALL